ncbi:MAG: hypothetical protein CMJ32_09670 [Phycisphaerae bacterium]|nr:hypothetical protein [Phycisphaerae bacterium]
MESTRAILVAWSVAMSLAILPSHGEDTVVVTFDNGPEGWSINGWDTIDPDNGNPGANINIDIIDAFGIEVRNSGPNENFIGDYFQKNVRRLGIDVEVNWILFGGIQVPRDFVVELRDYDNPPQGYQWVSVYLNTGPLPAAGSGWESIRFDVPLQEELPPGWGGTGAEDPRTFMPILPPDRTYGSVLQGVDAVVFTTFVPGYVFGFTDYNVRVDNISITTADAQPCNGDLTGDGSVGGDDLAILLAAWGPCPPKQPCPADLNGDKVIDGADIAVLLSEWGPCT